jgi:LETM1 and EF-hand domain-containing protein 1, mitochondrial
MEELIPLIAIYVPGMLPSTTIFASQLKRIEGKAQEKQAMFAARRTAFDRIVQAGQLVENGGQGKVVDLGQLRALGEDGTKVICGMLRLATWGPAPMQLWQIDRHLKHIAMDDELLANEDLGIRLRDEEVAKALDERGM